MLGGGFASIGGCGPESLIKIDGTDQGKARQVVLVRSDGRKGLVIAVGIRDDFEDVLFSSPPKEGISRIRRREKSEGSGFEVFVGIERGGFKRKGLKEEED